MDRPRTAIAGYFRWKGEWQPPLLCVALASWQFMVSVIPLNNWSAAVLQAFLVLAASLLASAPSRRGMAVMAWALCALSFGLSSFLLYVEREPPLSWPRGLVSLSHLLFAFHLSRMLGQVSFLREHGKLVLRCAAACSVFAICYVHVAATLLNHWHVAVIEVFFVLAVLFFLQLPAPKRGGIACLLLLIAVSMPLSNILATLDSKGLADWYRVVEMLSHMAFAVAMYFWFRSDSRAAEVMVLTTLSAVAMYFFVLVVAWNQAIDPATYDWVRRPPFFRNIRQLAYLLLLGMVIAAWAVLALRGRLRGLALVVFLLAASMLLWSGGRGAFIAACLGIACLLFRFGLRNHAQSWRWLSIAGLAAFLLSALFPVDSPGMGWLSALFRSGGGASADQISSGRLEIWSSLLPYIAERPWFGWGGEAFFALMAHTQVLQAHNGVLQLLLEWGCVGALLMLAVVGAVLFPGVKSLFRDAGSDQSSPTLVLGMSLMASLLFLSMVDGVFYHGLPLAFMMIWLACIKVVTAENVH
ncbi:O-Antigen ligase [compost metagenome]